MKKKYLCYLNKNDWDTNIPGFLPVAKVSKCQQKVEIILGQLKSQQKSAISRQGQQFLQISQKGIHENDVC